MRYKVLIRPLEPYTFGTEQGSKFAGSISTGKESYIIASNVIPEQTTILGTLRYIVLTQKKLLNSSFKYSQDEISEVEKVIGSKSFSFTEKETENFGLISSISPLFLEIDNEIFIKNPFCNNERKEGYRPYELEDKPVLTSKGMLYLPGEAYDSKAWHGTGYIGINSKKIKDENELFLKNVNTGNRTDNRKDKNREGFFKRECVSFKEKNLSFAIYVDTTEDDVFPDSIVAYMGLKKSAFIFDFRKAQDDDPLERQVEKAFEDNCDTWYYALSDIFTEGNLDSDEFAIIGEKKIRNLETVISADKYIEKRKKTVRQIRLITSGSTFKRFPRLESTDKYTNCGYNYVVKLGGNR